MFCLALQLALLAIVVYAEDEVQIIGGEDIDIKEAPYQVALLLSNYPHCGGAIVGDDVIITAAHCLVVTANPSDFSIRAGSSYTQKGGQIHQVRDFVSHPGWSYETEDYDIGIIWLAKTLSFNDVVQPIEMAKADDEVPDEAKTTVTGWVQSFPGSDDLPNLKRMRVIKISQLDCEKYYETFLKITSRMMCAGLGEGKEYICQGDSGSPQTYNNTLYGTVSWNCGYASPGLPRVFAKIAALSGWIDENIVLMKNKSNLKKGRQYFVNS